MTETRTTLPGGPAAAAGAASTTEAFETLRSLAWNRTGGVPAELFARHVLATHAGAPWEVQRAALEALLRRAEFAGRDALRVGRRPGRPPLGLFETRRPGERARPYATLLLGLDPLRASCDCPDFLRGSLGLCKHVFVVLEDLAGRARRWQEALASPVPADRTPELSWQPFRPLLGAGDWMDRIRLRRGEAQRRGRGKGLSAWFTRGVEGDWVLRETHAGRPERRLKMVQALLAEVREAASAGRSCDPALRALLAEEEQRLAQLCAQRRHRPSMEKALATLKRRLYPYQREGVAAFLGRGRLLLADDMGLGKTAQAIACCHALWRTRRVRRGLLIVPASLKFQWEREWHLFTDAPVERLEGGAGERVETYRSGRSGFLITNYEQLLRDLPEVLAWAPDIVVLDEAQRIKNWATKTAASVKRIQAPYRLVLTGTPMENRLEELASLMDWVDDHALEPKWRLVPLHSVHADGSREVVGARHLDTLRERLSGTFLRRRRDEVLKQLPPRTDTLVPVELTDRQREEHSALDLPIARLLSIARKRPLRQDQFLRLMVLLNTQRIIANGIAQLEFGETWPAISRFPRPDERLLRSLDSPKLIELREIVARIAVEQERKVVVFSQWRRMAQLAAWAVGDLLQDAGVTAAFFTGKETQKRRTTNLVAFHDDPRARLLFLTDAGGVGLNLQKAASACVILDLPWNPAVLEQRIGRIYRLGQTRPIDVYTLVSQESIEARIATLVADKRALFRELFDGSSDEVAFERSGSFLAGIQRLLEPAQTAADGADEEGEAAEPDTSAEQEAERMLERADEAADAEPGGGEERPQAADGTRTAGDGGGGSGGVPSDQELRALFAELEVAPTEQGGLRIEASPRAARSLAALLEGMAGLLRRSGGQ